MAELQEAAEELGLGLAAEEAGKGRGIRTVAVVGFGTMGQGIAQTISSKGMNVIVIEKTENALDRGMKGLADSIDREIERWGMTNSDKRAIFSRLEGTVNLHRIKDGDIVIEAIPEDLDAKQALFNQMGTICDASVIFISNTSSLSITEIAEGTNREDKIIGMHFLNPVPKIPVVELVRGMKTSDDTFHQTENFAEMLDKTPVEVFEYPGYITTRVIIPMLNEAMHAVMEGVSTPEGIDTAMKLGFNLTQGPLSMADMIGLDVIMSWMENLFKELGESKYRPCPLLRKMVRAGNLGRKTGRGFFVYEQ